jgi:8-oxo-dGTP pyrophosphatase MutT (NUDIX family)
MKTWLGVIIIPYKTNPLRILILENRKTGNISPPSGALEKGETLEEAAFRELKEEVGWLVNSEMFEVTEIKQDFIYSSNKKERAGDRGINQVLLLDSGNLPDARETGDTKNPLWLSVEEAVERASFEDLRSVIKEAGNLLVTGVQR